jgi:PAS domain S-box-containing protein
MFESNPEAVPPAPRNRPLASLAAPADVPSEAVPATGEGLAQDEKEYRRFFEDDLTGDFIATPTGELLACNIAFAEILGFDSVEQALATSTRSFYLDPAVRDRIIERLRREGSLKRIEFDLRRVDGRTVHVIENVVGIFDAAGELVQIRGYLFDITEEKRLATERAELLMRERTARALAEAAERRATFLAEIGNLLATSLDYRATLASVARLVVPTLADYCLIDEATPERGSRRVASAHADPEMEGRLLREEYNPPDADPARHPALAVMRTGQPVLVSQITEQDLNTIAHDAEHREMLLWLGPRSYFIVPLVARGRTLGALTLVASSSGRQFSMSDLELGQAVAARAALAVDNARLYSQLQQAARIREEVLAFVSHDLRNPLATILLNASALIDTMPADRLHREEREQLDWIARASEQMNRMIQDLLDVARIESGRIPMRLDEMEVDDLLQEACLLLQPLACEKRLQLELSPVARGMVVRVDRERFLRVLSNVIGNSIKFTESGGSIRLTVERMDAEVRFTVADTGIGIVPEDAPHVFEPYRQGRGVVHGRERGSGLGLTIARGIIEAHGGRIWFLSNPGEGTAFHFTVPAVPAAHRAAAGIDLNGRG